MISLSTWGLDKHGRRARMARIGQAILAEWSAEARQQLRKTLPAYLRALQIREMTEDRVVVSLPGPDAPEEAAQLARIVEFGMGPGGIGTEGPYDVRTFLLREGTKSLRWTKGRAATKNKPAQPPQPYVNVPFGHTEASIRAMGETAGAGGGDAAVREFLALTETRSLQDGTTVWGGSLPSGLAEKLKPHNVTDPLHGAVRMVAAYSEGAAGPNIQGQGRTWRRASWSNQDPLAWLSSGVKARRIAAKVAENVDNVVAEAL